MAETKFPRVTGPTGRPGNACRTRAFYVTKGLLRLVGKLRIEVGNGIVVLKAV